jgi:hypothetical protein
MHHAAYGVAQRGAALHGRRDARGVTCKHAEPAVASPGGPAGLRLELVEALGHSGGQGFAGGLNSLELCGGAVTDVDAI